MECMTSGEAFAVSGRGLHGTSIGENICVGLQSTDRFAAAYLSDKIGEDFQGRVNGIAKFGLFISLDKISIDGLVPIRSLSDDFYKFDERRMLLKGSRNGFTFSLGMCVKVKIKESNPISGTLLLELVDTYHRSKSPERRPKKRNK